MEDFKTPSFTPDQSGRAIDNAIAPGRRHDGADMNGQAILPVGHVSDGCRPRRWLIGKTSRALSHIVRKARIWCRLRVETSPAHPAQLRGGRERKGAGEGTSPALGALNVQRRPCPL